MNKFDLSMSDIFSTVYIIRWTFDYKTSTFYFGEEATAFFDRWNISEEYRFTSLSLENLAALVPDEFKQEVVDKFLESLENKKKYSLHFPFDLKFVNQKGKIWLNSIIYHEFKETGEFNRTYGIIQDVSNYKKIEEDLQQAQKLGHLGHWSFVGGVLQISDNLAETLELGLVRELEFDEFLNIVAPESKEVIARDFFEALVNKKEIEFDFKASLRSGSEKYLHCIVKVGQLSYPSRESAYGVMQDITYEKKTQLELIEAKERAERSDYLKSVFLANMSHEIRTPLNSIVGFSEILANKDLSDDRKKKYGEIIKKGSYQLKTLISDIIDISKIESGDMNIYEETVNLAKILDEVKDLFESNPKNDLISLEIDNSLKKNYVFRTDRVRLIQIFSNLISNAYKFTEKGSITFGVRKVENNNIYFYVKDTGIGISEDAQKIIFNRFRQEEEGKNRKFEGTGLGLAICQSLLNLLKGEIWVESKKNEGSIFCFILPCYGNEKHSDSASTEVLEFSNREGILANKKVLIVDDHEDIHYFLREYFESEGASCDHAYNGFMALKLCEMYNFDLVMMDVQMPKMDGLEATVLIKKDYPKLPIIAQTAYALVGDRERFLESGADGYVTKPIDVDKLETLIESLVAK